MIKAFIFNLDGPLIQMDNLQAESFARAAIELRSDGIKEKDVVAAYKEIAHLSRFEIIQELIKKFRLKESALSEMDRYNVSTPWQAFAQVRIESYEIMMNDPLVILKNYCPRSLDLLLWARQKKYKIGLTSGLSYAKTIKALRLLDISFEFDFVTSMDDAGSIKPDPEMNHMIAGQLETDPAECLVIEDSMIGVKAAFSANMKCVCVVNDFNREMINNGKLMYKDLIAVNPGHLKKHVNQLINKYGD